MASPQAKFGSSFVFVDPTHRPALVTMAPTRRPNKAKRSSRYAIESEATDRSPDVDGKWPASATLAFIMITCGAFWGAVIYFALKALHQL